MTSSIFPLCILALISVSVLATESQSNDINSSLNEQSPISPATPKVAQTSTTSIPIQFAASTSSPILPIMRAIEIIEFVSKFSNSNVDGFGVTQIHSQLEMSQNPSESSSSKGDDNVALSKTTDPLTALSSVAVYGALKITSLLLSVFMYFTTMLFPGFFGGSVNFSTSYKTSTAGMFDQIDYNLISESIKTLPEKSFRLFDINEIECQSRAMCEIGQTVGGYFPMLGKGIRFLAERFNLKDHNTEAIIRGLGWSDCNVSYRTCPRSPFKKFQHLISTFNKFY